MKEGKQRPFPVVCLNPVGAGFFIAMFTGIITNTGVVSDVSPSRITIRARRTLVHKLDRGASIGVDGACLTVVAKDKESFTADVMLETARRTTLAILRRGTKVNLELPATPASFLSGHVVQGHVDGVGIVKQIRAHGMNRILSIAVPKKLSRYVVEKGSVAVNGVSLTVIKATRSHFTIGIIPHTWHVTTLSGLSAGDRVNIEVDVLAKYLEKFTKKRSI